jgi:hypothetical protein
VRPSTYLFGERPFVSRPAAVRVSGAALAVGLIASSIAFAAPAGAGEPMRVDLHKLRICESGDHYKENTGNGYYGAYQFAPTTWRSLGFKGRPDHAKAAVQNRAARKEHRVAGWGAWPSCSASQHLR